MRVQQCRIAMIQPSKQVELLHFACHETLLTLSVVLIICLFIVLGVLEDVFI